MKHTLSLFAIFLMALAVPQSVMAYDFSAVSPSGHTLYYNIVSGNAEVTFQNDESTSYTNLTGNLVIPSSVTYGSVTYNVTSIGSSAFDGCSGLTSVTIPSSVTSIGEYAFAFCSGLTSVTIPNSVTSIGSVAFWYCSGLTSVTIPNSVTCIGTRAFYNCSGLDTVYMKPTTPPTLGNSAFYDNASGRVFILSGCSYNDYYNASTWTSYRSALQDPIIDIDISLATNDPQRGNVSIIQLHNRDVRCDSTAVIQSTANYGYHFTQWSDGNTENPRTITLTQDTAFTAQFDRNEYQLTLTSANPTLGTVTGSGTFLYLDTAHIVATATEHHHLVHWSDGSTEATRDIVITADLQLTATFAIDTNTVNVAVNDIVRGMVQASGTEFAYGTPCTVTATAYTGYTFSSWSNGVTANPYTFAVMNDVELTAIFLAPGEETYTVTVSSANPTMGSATVNGNASATVMSDETVTLTATANTGYRFVRWSDNNTEATRTVTVTADMSFTAYFESDGTEGIGEVGEQSSEVRVYAVEGKIVVEGAEGETVRVYDVMGRMVTCSSGTYAPALTGTPSNLEGEFRVPTSGVYLVKVGQYPARKVVVIR